MTSARISGEFSLEDLANHLDRNRPDHGLLEGGWAGVNDDQSNLGVLNAAPPTSNVQILAAEGEFPERLLARYYYWSERKGLREARPDASDAELHELAAIDILVSPHAAGQFLLLVSTLDVAAARRHPLKKLELVMQALDVEAKIDLQQSPLRLPGGDTFLWLLVKARDSRMIDANIEIRDIEAVHGQDSVQRVTVLNNSVSFDRPSFLIAVAEGDELGPAKLTLYDGAANVRISFRVWPSGAFSVVTGSTYYPDIMDTATWRLQAVYDISYRFIPILVATYVSDQEWRTEIRAREIRAAAEALVARYSEQTG
ncbi:hypothetical protein ACFZA2_15365 [Microbacterium sp. NPDC007973]|uniref:hypothetical protein n=1 Tax=Microbacterium sp. NPDC007973 TaxID=3364182 RepID=UPI0036EBC38F